MHELYELKDKLMDELKEYGAKEMSAGSLDVVDKLTHTLKNLCIIDEYDEMGEAYDYRDGYRYDGREMYPGRRKRDSRGRYTSENRYYRTDDDFKSKLHAVMMDAPNDRTREEIKKVIDRM